MMFRVFDVVTRLVTTNDDLMASVEGLDCVMIETMIRNYSGNLQRAWMTLHRASAIAQMLGLHRDVKSASLKFLDAATKDCFDFEHVGFVLANMDCYLSMTLGLPKSSFAPVTPSAQALAETTPLQRLVYMQCVIADRILERNLARSKEQPSDLSQIDQLLHDAAAEMPPQWWLIPDFDAEADDTKSFQQHARVNLQLTQYHLIVRLHLPFLLRPPQDPTYDHSKFTIANTSRDILSLYIAFRKWISGRFYCRGIDYLVFIAVTTLCVAHVNARNKTKTLDTNNNVTGKFFIQNRLRDRGLMERSLLVLQQMGDDAIATKLVQILEHLLFVEADAFNGTEYSTVAIESDVAAAGCEGTFVDSRKTYQLRMPYFGTINLQPKQVSRSDAGLAATTNEADGTTLFGPTVGLNQGISLHGGSGYPQQPQPPYGIYPTDSQQQAAFDMVYESDNWTLQSINDSLFDSLFTGTCDQETFFNMPLNEQM